MPWEVLLLFGGGFALASAFRLTGLGAWLATELGGPVALARTTSTSRLITSLSCIVSPFVIREADGRKREISGATSMYPPTSSMAVSIGTQWYPM